MKKTNKVVNNTIMLYIMSIAKLIFPLLTLPYLTRVLSKETYGFVSYVKSCMTYIQLIVDFGFILSSVKDIVQANGDMNKVGIITGNTFFAKFILSFAALGILVVMLFTIDLLKFNVTYVILSFTAIAISVFLADFLFRGIEKMYFITIIYVLAKGVATVLTFILVRDDESFMWIPILDIISNVISILISFGIIIFKLKIKVRMSGIKESLYMIKESFTYFLSSIATTAFSALNTVLIGIYITDLIQVAYWSLCLNLITAVQSLYAPLCNSIYPHMIQNKNLNIIHKVLAIFMPIVTLGCIFCFYFARMVLIIVGGKEYAEAYILFRWLIPILFFSFPAQIYGWPTLGAVGKVKETTFSTVIAAITQVLGIFLLIIFNSFNLINLAVLRGLTELILMLVRMFITYKNKKYFNGEKYEFKR